MRSTSVLAAAVLSIAATILAAPADADACSPPVNYVNVLPPSQPLTAPLEGPVVAWMTRGEPNGEPDLGTVMTVMVVDASGAAVPGDITWLQLRESYDATFGSDKEGLLLWRPDAPLTDGESYTLQVQSDGEYGEWGTLPPAPFDAPFVATADPEALSPPVLEGLTLAWEEVALSLDTACPDTESGGECPDCAFVDQALRVKASAMLPGDGRFGYRELVTTNGDAIALHRMRRWDGEDAHGAHVWFADEQETYCVAVEAVDLVTGEVVRSEESCLEAPEAPVEPEPDAGGTPDAGSEPDAGGGPGADGGSGADAGGGSGSAEPGGCATASTAPSPWFAAFFGLAVVRIRRRRVGGLGSGVSVHHR